MLGSFKVWAFIVKTGSHIGLLFRAQLRIQLRIQHQQLCWLFVFLCNASVRLMWILCRFKGKLTCKLTEQFTCRIVDGHMVKWRHKKVLQISRVRCYIVMLTPAFIYWKKNNKKKVKNIFKINYTVTGVSRGLALGGTCSLWVGVVHINKPEDWLVFSLIIWCFKYTFLYHNNQNVIFSVTE